MTITLRFRTPRAVALALGLLALGLGSVSEARVDPAGLGELWTRYGTGLVTDLAVAEADGGPSALVVGGRGIGAVHEASLRDGRFRWVNKWSGAEDPPGDGETAQELRLGEINGDGVVDTFAGSPEALFAIDGRTGRTLWISHDEGSEFSRGAWDVATADFDQDGVVDAAFADLVDDRVTAVDGPTGAQLWYYPREGIVTDLATGDLDLDGRADTVAIGAESNPEIHAISGASGDDGVAEALWTQPFPATVRADRPGAHASDPRVVAVAQVVAETSEPEVVVAGGDGNLNVLEGPTGDLIGAAVVDGAIADVAVLDLDGDADFEIVAAVDFPFGARRGSLHAFDPSGDPLWTLPTAGAAVDLAVADLTGDRAVELLVVGGWLDVPPDQEPPGYAMALGTEQRGAPEPAVLWHADLPEYASTVEVGNLFGELTVAVGQGEEGGVWGLGASGKALWYFRTGGRVEEVAGADLDRDGDPEIVEGADDATVAVSDGEGRLLWQARVPGPESPDVIEVATGELVPSRGLEVVAGTWEFDLTGPRGRLHAFSSRGSTLWSADLLGTADDLLVNDVDGDRRDDVVVATSVDGSAARFDGSGGLIWQRSVTTGLHASIALLDVNGDAILDVIVGSKPFVGGDVSALDGTDGTELWHRAMPAGINWLAATGDPDDDVLAGDLAGTVFRLDAATGDAEWQSDLGSSSWDGAWSVDLTGDGIRDVVSVFEDGTARMLDASTGRQLWASPTDGQPGFVVATVPGRAPRIAVGTLATGPITPAAVYVFDARTGRRLGAADVQSTVLDLASANLRGNRDEELLAAAGWQVHAFDVP
jgi:outer membrane protein assembly factor BamB